VHSDRHEGGEALDHDHFVVELEDPGEPEVVNRLILDHDRAGEITAEFCGHLGQGGVVEDQPAPLPLTDGLRVDFGKLIGCRSFLPTILVAGTQADLVRTAVGPGSNLDNTVFDGDGDAALVARYIEGRPDYVNVTVADLHIEGAGGIRRDLEQGLALFQASAARAVADRDCSPPYWC